MGGHGGIAGTDGRRVGRARRCRSSGWGAGAGPTHRRDVSLADQAEPPQPLDHQPNSPAAAATVAPVAKGLGAGGGGGRAPEAKLCGLVLQRLQPALECRRPAEGSEGSEGFKRNAPRAVPGIRACLGLAWLPLAHFDGPAPFVRHTHRRCSACIRCSATACLAAAAAASACSSGAFCSDQMPIKL